MKKIIMIGIAGWLLSGSVLAEQGVYPFGVSSGLEDETSRNTTDWLLKQQRETQPARQSELPTPLYVESQNRLGTAFTQPIPDTLKDHANSRQGSR